MAKKESGVGSFASIYSWAATIVRLRGEMRIRFGRVLPFIVSTPDRRWQQKRTPKTVADARKASATVLDEP